ncbi:DNA-directed RNA polymerase II subunit rpb1 [Fusarium oxysporum f. sp. albedinis]|nr:DNA-directed RNA polymerase II subunit rpb1 [Fusarium oxysporum f. sp. albedinis]
MVGWKCIMEPASANTLMKDAQMLDEIGIAYDTLCFEIEPSELTNRFPCSVTREICDYCDSYRNTMLLIRQVIASQMDTVSSQVEQAEVKIIEGSHLMALLSLQGNVVCIAYAATLSYSSVSHKQRIPVA